jgi:hypothetical protein
MSQKSPFYLLITCFLFLSLALPGFAFAKDDKFSFRLWGQVSPFLSGDAGSGSGAPRYDDAFNTGLGAGAELSWRFSNRLSGLAGIGYENYSGDNHEGISFDDLEVIPVYLGGKFHIFPDGTKWDLYFRMDIGAAYLSSVHVSYYTLKGKYWDSSWVFLLDGGAGIEYRWNRWGVSLDAKLRYLGRPDPILGPPSKADSSWTVPIVLGVNYHF